MLETFAFAEFTGNDFEWVVFSRDRRDANRRRPGDEKYDPRTLYLPPDFVKNLTGGQVFDFLIRLVLGSVDYIFKLVI